MYTCLYVEARGGRGVCIPAVPLFILLRQALSLTLKLTVFHLGWLARKPQQFSCLYPLSLRDEVIVASSHIFVGPGDPSPGLHDYAQ